MALNVHEKGFTISKTLSVRKRKWKILKNFVSKLLIWCQKWVAGVRHGNTLVVRQVEPSMVIAIFFSLTKYAVPRKIKPEILKLIIRGGQSNFSIAFIFVTCKGRSYYRVVSVGQLSFDWRSYCGLNRRM